ncbi:TetR/AcrR family transcriptional regulator [Companilactobacillus metriopterae]|uniref:TetR/AcrR family transcriptional regulator n=1 Tax=Companilactobacillus metriopterae TaxID=1909267 RepID=UPI00100AC7DC|nr:TetR/AcrR family transcriptional regulator [Companilactobacillus metriopterae]
MNSRELQAEKTKNNILEVATESFFTKGFQATSTRQIAQELGITQPNMYHYFKNKKVLYAESIDFSMGEFGNNLLKYYNENKDDPFSELLLKISTFMIENFKINYFLMRHDIETFFTDEEKKNISQNWGGGYYKVLYNIFQSNKEVLRKDIALPVQVGTYLTMLLPYIEYDEESRRHNIANLKTMVEIFINGVKIKNEE